MSCISLNLKKEKNCKVKKDFRNLDLTSIDGKKCYFENYVSNPGKSETIGKDKIPPGKVEKYHK